MLRPLLAGVLLLALPLPMPAAPDPLAARIATALEAAATDLVAFRRDLHQHPELSGDEVRTAARVAERLRALGLEVATGVGGHGVIALLRGGRPGPVVAFRADMDAVANRDPDPVAFASEVSGVRHICGHDVHTTIGLALATALASVRADLPGAVLFVFQPAEERASGAHAMLADEVFRLARPVAFYAVHTAPLEVGTLGVTAGPMLAGRDQVEFRFDGAGNLDSAAEALTASIRALDTGAEPGPGGGYAQEVALVEVFRRPAAAGTRAVIANLRIAGAATRAAVRRRIDSARRGAERGGVRLTVDYREKVIAGVTNDSNLTAHAIEAVTTVLGTRSVVPIGLVDPRFSEDFGAFQDQAPGVMFLLGVSNRERGWVGMPHAPEYVADEAAIGVGARAMAAVLLERLRRGA